MRHLGFAICYASSIVSAAYCLVNKDAGATMLVMFSLVIPGMYYIEDKKK